MEQANVFEAPSGSGIFSFVLTDKQSCIMYWMEHLILRLHQLRETGESDKVNFEDIRAGVILRFLIDGLVYQEFKIVLEVENFPWQVKIVMNNQELVGFAGVFVKTLRGLVYEIEEITAEVKEREALREAFHLAAAERSLTA